ncbi:MAG: type IV pilus assembly protein PilM [Desulfuromonas thiophila]|jgi:type IV pilus assembly protein PilM|nr:type IV pilus assembly protein PilM [Desulfuromonas thiophila]
MFGAKKDVIGIDIGASAVKLVRLHTARSGYLLKNLDREPLPPEAVVDSSIMDSRAVVQAVRDIVARNGIKTTDVVTSVSGHSVIIRKISLPLMTEDELENSIQWEAEQYIPFEMADVYLDYHILGPDPNDQGLMEVVLVAAKREFVDEYVSVIRESGLNPIIMDVDCFAIENIFCALYPDEAAETVALIDVGASGAQVSVLKGGVSVFTREIQIGGDHYNEELQKRFGLSSEDAEALKLRGAFEGVDADQAQAALDRVSTTLVQEIRRSLDFFSATFADERVVRVYVTGGVVQTQGLLSALQEGLGVEVAILDPFSRMTIHESEFDLTYVKSVAPFFAVAAGLATRRAGDKS